MIYTWASSTEPSYTTQASSPSASVQAPTAAVMSYHFAIIGTKDNPLFTHDFGTSKGGGDGQPRFRDAHMNQFIVHSSLDLVEEVQWTTGAMYLKNIDRFQSSHISCFLTGTGMKFLLLHNPDPTGAPGTTNPTHGHHASLDGGGGLGGGIGGGKTGARIGGASSATSSVAANPTSPAAEEAVRQFFADVFENWVKTSMNPFYRIDTEIKSPVFRQRVAAAARKYL